MDCLNVDQHRVQSQANIFAAHLISSIINSSSKYNLSPVNTDGPELRKNLHGLSYFCYAQGSSEECGELPALYLLKRALQPVSESIEPKSEASSQLSTFQGSSINFAHNKHFPEDKWRKLLEKIDIYSTRVRDGVENKSNGISPGNLNALNELLAALFVDWDQALPLAMRSCANVVVLRGVPEDNSRSTQWEQTALTKILESLFPKAAIHYYITYHKIKDETITILPSGYISHEILGFIVDYLSWEGKPKKSQMAQIITNSSQILTEEIEKVIGYREHFECKYDDFNEILARASGLFGLSDEAWENSFITAKEVADMINRIHGIISLIKREPEKGDDNWDDSLDF